MPPRPTLAVVLLNWQDEAQTLRCAAAVRGWTSLKPVLIVVDNQSTAASRLALETGIPAAKILCSESNRGYSGGNNLGIQCAIEQHVDHVMLLNTDACIAESGVLGLIGTLQTHPDIALVGPVLQQGANGNCTCLAGGRDIARHGSTRIAVDTQRVKNMPGYPLYEVDYVPGTILLARRSVFEQVGLFDERFFFSGEAADLCRRCREKVGRTCIDLAVHASHDTAHTSPEMRETVHAYYSLRNRFLFVRKHYPSTQAWYFARWTVIGGWEFAKSVARARFRRARALWFALMHGLGNKFGNQNVLFNKQRLVQ